jgi:hypothetical protein
VPFPGVGDGPISSGVGREAAGAEARLDCRAFTRRWKRRSSTVLEAFVFFRKLISCGFPVKNRGKRARVPAAYEPKQNRKAKSKATDKSVRPTRSKSGSKSSEQNMLGAAVEDPLCFECVIQRGL